MSSRKRSYSLGISKKARTLSYKPRQFTAPAVTRAAIVAARAAKEVKGMDTLIDQAVSIVSTVGTNANCQVLNLIQSGSGSWNRVGRKVSLKSLRLRGVAQYNTTFGALQTNADNWLRMVVVWDQQPSGGTIPTYDTVFATTIQDGTETGGILAPVRYDNMDRFRVLKDSMIHFSQDVNALSTGTTTVMVPFDEYISLGGRETVFSGQTVPMTIADISTGGLYIYFRAAATGVSVQAAAIAGSPFARLRYND